MPQFQIAHIHEQGQDIIIVPLADSFHHKTQAEKLTAVNELQMRASNASPVALAGTVVVAWDDPSGRTYFLGAPREWQPFFSNLSMAAVLAMRNKTLSW
jgi:hypothetical protein